MTAALMLVLSACKDSPSGSEPEQSGNGQEPVLEAIISYTPQSPEVGTQVTLDATDSNDDQGIGYDVEWTFNSKPSGSNATIDNATSATATFTPDVVGDYTVDLTISNSDEGVSDSEQATITSVSVSSQELSGAVDSDRTLENIIEDPAQADYLLTGNLDVNATLTVEPGVIMHVQEDLVLSINSTGALIAEGTETDSIRITSADAESGLYWKGIYINSSSS